MLENPEFRREQLLQFNDYIASKIYEAWGPITDETGCEVEILPLVELKGDSKTTKLSVTFTATVLNLEERR